MLSLENQTVALTQRQAIEVLENTLKALCSKFYKPELLDSDWLRAVDEHRALILGATSSDAFEKAVSSLLQQLTVSHLGFFHRGGRRASSRAALSATYLAVDTMHGNRWVFQDVHAGGAAATAGIQPGNVLLCVNGQDIVPPEHPVFQLGSKSVLTVEANDERQKDLTVEVARSKGRKLQFVEPALVQSQMLHGNIGYLKVAMFPGMLGVDVANAMSQAIVALEGIDGLIVDLRGNTGGGAGALRLMSLLTAHRIPVGFAPDRKWIDRNTGQRKETLPRLNRIPKQKAMLWLLGIRFLPALLRKLPVVLETEGLGAKTYQGRIAILVDRHTASAAEMVAIFAKENNLATIVGEPTAGRLLSATSVNVGHGFRLALPTGAYHTWNGTVVEGSPVHPNVLATFDWQRTRAGLDDALQAACNVLTSRG